jgi:glycerol kinase
MLAWLATDLGLAPDVPALVALAASVPDAAGVRILPAFGGLGAPWWRPEARGVIAGLSASTRPAHMARAALDAIAQRVADIVRAADLVMPIVGLRIDGGLTRAPGFAERQATILGRPVWRTDADATARGAAALAAVGAGILARIEDIDPLLPAFERVDPDPDGTPADAQAWAGFVERAAALLDGA